MAVNIGVKKPTNSVVERGNPLVGHYFVETATSMEPGKLVKGGTTDADIVTNTDANMAVLGFLGYEQANQVDRPADVDTAYAANASAPVLYGGNFNLRAYLAATTTCADGDQLFPAASGCLKTWATGVTVPVAIARETCTYNAAAQTLVVTALR